MVLEVIGQNWELVLHKSFEDATANLERAEFRPVDMSQVVCREEAIHNSEDSFLDH